MSLEVVGEMDFNLAVSNQTAKPPTVKFSSYTVLILAFFNTLFSIMTFMHNILIVTVESRNQSLYRLLQNSNFAALIISDL